MLGFKKTIAKKDISVKTNTSRDICNHKRKNKTKRDCV